MPSTHWHHRSGRSARIDAVAVGIGALVVVIAIAGAVWTRFAVATMGDVRRLGDHGGGDAALDAHDRIESGVQTLVAIVFAVAVPVALLLVVILAGYRRSRHTLHQQAFVLEEMATIDSLTDLPNRRVALGLVDQVLEGADRESPAVVMFIDLDGFKLINDVFGHRSGDEVLREFAFRMQPIVPADATLARLGGDEFVVIFPAGVPVSRASVLASMVLAALRVPFDIYDATIDIGASIGIAAGWGIETSALFSQADEALYESKRSGRNRVTVFDEVLAEQQRSRRQVEAELLPAVNRGEITIALQPIIDVGAGTTLGAEALIRWDHPERGRLMPGAFVPIAEQSSLIVELDRCVLGLACEVLAGWQQRERDLHLAINVSTRYLLHQSLLCDIQAALARTGARADGLWIELTESQLIEDIGRAASVLVPLREMGVRIALDDFGVGYSSLGYLRALPLDTLKIDRSYVDAIRSDRDREIVGNMTQLARILGLDVVAEGVETPEQLAAVREVGCDAAQGYHIGLPMSHSEFERWYATHGRGAAAPATRLNGSRALAAHPR